MLTTHATPRAAHRNQDPAEMAGRHSELSPWQARDHPLGEEHVSASKVLGSVHGWEHGLQTLPHPQGQLQKSTPHLMRESNKRLQQPQTNQGGNSYAKVTAQQNGQQIRAQVEFELWYPGPIHALEKMAGQCPELSPGQARCHPCGVGYEQAGTVLGHAQRGEQGIKPLSESHGQKQKIGPSTRETMDEGQGHQPRMLLTKNLDLDSRPMRKAYSTARHHPFRGDHAPGALTGKKIDPASHAPRTSAEAREQLLNPEIPRGPYVAEGCAKIAEFLAHAP